MDTEEGENEVENETQKQVMDWINTVIQEEEKELSLQDQINSPTSTTTMSKTITTPTTITSTSQTIFDSIYSAGNQLYDWWGVGYDWYNTKTETITTTKKPSINRIDATIVTTPTTVSYTHLTLPTNREV